MNYRHAFHAGSFADVLKHAVLTRALLHLGDKAAAFRVIDTHAGAGRYDLHGAEAKRTGEWQGGIGKLFDDPPGGEAGALLAPYLAVVRAENAAGKLRYYPGSPLIARALCRPQDRMIFCEREPGARKALVARLGRDPRAKISELDGWTGLKALLPPPERRGLVLVDPPFEEPDELARLLAGLAEAHRRFAGGTYLLWYAMKEPARDRKLLPPRRSPRHTKDPAAGTCRDRAPPRRAARRLRPHRRQPAVDAGSRDESPAAGAR
jgi:23S rRNA (adenine2030-N6)-methyltransferase